MDSRSYPGGRGGLVSRYVDGVLKFYNTSGAVVYSIDAANRTVDIPSGSTFSNAGTLSFTGTQSFDDLLLSGYAKLADNAFVSFGDKTGTDADVSMRWDGTNFVVLPDVDDQGSFNIGNGTLDMDLKVFLGTSSDYVLFDVGNKTFSTVGDILTSFNQTITSATPATTRLVRSVLTVNSTSNTFAVSGGGSLAGLRGEVVGSSGDTLTAGYIYGTQGKLTLPITFGNGGKVTGVLGQADLSSATINAGGQASGVWADLQGNPTIADDSPGQVYPLRVTNSMSVDAGALAFFYGKADYFMVASADGATADWISNPGGFTGSGATSKLLKVQVAGQVLYILAAGSWS